MTTTFDQQMEQIAAGERLPVDEIRRLAASPDVLPLGMLADTLRRRLHGARATYVRVSSCQYDHSFTEAVQPAAQEIRITGAPESIEVAVTAVETARRLAGERTVAGFSWTDVERLAAGADVARVLETLRHAGLDALGEIPLDETADLPGSLRALQGAGFERVRLSVSRLAAAERTALLLRAGQLQDEFGIVESLDPLPASVSTFRPTTGYEDVKMVAIARLAAPAVPSIQVDWRRYGPKLAQVALTFGADDLYGISASDEAPEGRRRAPVEEIRRNIQAAGFEPVERNGRFVPLA